MIGYCIWRFMMEWLSDDCAGAHKTCHLMLKPCIYQITDNLQNAINPNIDIATIIPPLFMSFARISIVNGKLNVRCSCLKGDLLEL